MMIDERSKAYERQKVILMNGLYIKRWFNHWNYYWAPYLHLVLARVPETTQVHVQASLLAPLVLH